MGTYENGGMVKVFMWVDVRSPRELSVHTRKVTLFSAFASSPEDSKELVAEFFRANAHVHPESCQCVFVPHSVWL